MAFHLNIGFVDPVGFVGRLQVRTAALIEFRPEDLDPAPDAGSVDSKAPFIHEIRHLPIAQREAQVPTHTHEDDWVFVMPPEERIGRPNGHRFTLPQSDSSFRNTTNTAHHGGRLVHQLGVRARMQPGVAAIESTEPE